MYLGFCSFLLNELAYYEDGFVVCTSLVLFLNEIGSKLLTSANIELAEKKNSWKI